MSIETQGFDAGLMQANRDLLADNSFPGEGIVLGNSVDGRRSVQAYWIMGRGEYSHNRVLVEEHAIVKTEIDDPTQLLDPSLAIHNAMREGTIYRPALNEPKTHLYVVSNGDQTDSVCFRTTGPKHRAEGWAMSFRNALMAYDYESDYPDYTSRITGMIATRDNISVDEYYYSIIRRNPTTGEPEHTFGQGVLEHDVPRGAGICFHTYRGEADPLPTFEGSPYAIPLEASASEIADSLWENLDRVNRIALVAKTIDKLSGAVELTIKNQLDG